MNGAFVIFLQNSSGPVHCEMEKKDMSAIQWINSSV